MKSLNLLERIPQRAWFEERLWEATPSRIIHEEGSFRLKLFSSWERPTRGQVLIFPSLINRPYVLDMGRGRSLIQALNKSGFEVALFDWGSPGPREIDLGLKGLFEHRVLPALSSLKAHSNVDEEQPRTLLGHCLGGNLALLFAGQRPALIDRIALLTTPIDFDNRSLLNTWVQSPDWDADQFARALEVIPWPLMQMSFLLLRPSMTPRRWISLAQNLRDRDFRESWLQMELWSNDNVSFSGELFRDLVIPLFRQNALMDPNSEFGRRLGTITQPLFSIAAEDDHLVPLSSALALREAIPNSKIQLRTAKGGHIGAVLSRRARKNIWPELISFCGLRRERPCEFPLATLHDS